MLLTCGAWGAGGTRQAAPAAAGIAMLGMLAAVCSSMPGALGMLCICCALPPAASLMRSSLNSSAAPRREKPAARPEGAEGERTRVPRAAPLCTPLPRTGMGTAGGA